MAALAFDESCLKYDKTLAQSVAPPCGGNCPRYVSSTFLLNVRREPICSLKEGVVRARAPHPEDLDSLEREVQAPAELAARSSPVGEDPDDLEREVGGPAESAAPRSPGGEDPGGLERQVGAPAELVAPRRPVGEDPGDLERGVKAPAEPAALRSPVGENPGGLEREVKAPVESTAPRSPVGARTHASRAVVAGSKSWTGAAGAAVLALRAKVIGKASDQKSWELIEAATPAAPASPPRAVFRSKARSYPRW